MEDRSEYRIDNKSIGERLRNEREKFGLTRESMADLVNLSPVYIGQLERGERQASLNTLMKVSDCFNVSTDKILKGDSENIKLKTKNVISILEECSETELELIEKIIRTLVLYCNRDKETP